MIDKRQSAILNFLAGEAGSALLLIAATGLALIAANLPGGAGHVYHALIDARTGPVLMPELGPMTVHLWVNDGLMAIFFLVVGLEIKREMVVGELSTWRQRRLPFIAAGAGMVAPALVYLAIAGGQADLLNGWAIPAATDIAFAIGVLALIGSRAPASLKLFLTAVAIVDDMGAVAIIALFYGHGLNVTALAAAAGIWIAMLLVGRLGVKGLAPYLIGFLLLWYAMLLSGVHATVAGVLAAMTVPVKGAATTAKREDSPLHRLEHKIHPWSAYLIVPLFGFTNAGLTLGEGLGSALLAPLVLAVAAGLFVGKQLGIFGAIWLAERLGLAERPAGATWAQVYGVALLCGIGFTMSLFIGGLAFPQVPDRIEEAKLGVVLGSLAAALTGFTVLRWTGRKAG
jgi:NhaA family Na+:H+ antiporter